MRQSAAAALAFGLDDFNAKARQQAARRGIDAGGQHGLGATLKHHDPAFSRTGYRRIFHRFARRNSARRQRDHRRRARADAGQAADQPGKRLGRQCADQRQPEPSGIGQNVGQHATQHPVVPGPLVAGMDIGAGMIDQMHVIDPRRAGGHAGQARQAPVDMFHNLDSGRLVVLQHVLDQVNPSARRIQFIAEQQIGRAGRGAKPAMHAGAQDFLGFLHVGIGEGFGREGGLHGVRFLQRRGQRPDACQRPD